jgi:hypothetical protein
MEPRKTHGMTAKGLLAGSQREERQLHLKMLLSEPARGRRSPAESPARRDHG